MWKICPWEREANMKDTTSVHTPNLQNILVTKDAQWKDY